MIVVLGNRDAIVRTPGEADPDNLDAPVEDVVTPGPEGKQATVIEVDDTTPLGEAFVNITAAGKGVWAFHAAEGATPAWVASDSDAMALLLSEQYGGIEVRALPEGYDPKRPDAHRDQGSTGDDGGNGGGGNGDPRTPSPAGALATSTSLLSVMFLVAFLAFTLSKAMPWLKTNAGNDFQAAQMAGSASATAVAKWVAVTANTTAPAATDTTLTAEITTAGGGLIRKVGTYAHTTGAASYTLTTTFTANGSDSLPVTLGKRGIFDAASAGNLVFSTLISPTATLSASGDQVTLTDTITL